MYQWSINFFSSLNVYLLALLYLLVGNKIYYELIKKNYQIRIHF